MSRVKDVTTPRLQNFLEFQKDPLFFFLNMLDKGDIVSLRTGFKPSFIVNSPEFVKEILVTKDSYFRKGRTTKVLRRTIGDGLLTTEKEEHRRQKNYYQPIFYKERLNHYAMTMVEETKKLVETLQHRKNCNLSDEMMQLTLVIISKVMFATDLEKSKEMLAEAVSETIEQTAHTLLSPVILPLNVPTKRHKIHKQAIFKLENMINEIIKQAKENPENYQKTMVGMMLDTTFATGERISDEEIRNQMMTMLLAGHETSANLLTWIFYALSQNPEVEWKFHEEIDAISLLEESPFEVYSKLAYTQQMMKEALRLFPPAWLIYREADKDVELLGERFKEGSTFMICSYAIHRNYEMFPNPEEFQPDRFTSGYNESIPPFAYFPFGGGSRSCIGYKFAVMETVLILAIIGRKYKFQHIEGEQAIPDPLVSLRIKGGLKMEIIER